MRGNDNRRPFSVESSAHGAHHHRGTSPQMRKQPVESGEGTAQWGLQVTQDLDQPIKPTVRMTALEMHHARNYQVVVPPLLLLSGIGEISRAGIVLNPFLGLRFKAAVVTTDLPLKTDKPIDFGLQNFCAKCKKCARECPSRAIPSADEKTVHNGYETWELDVERCTKYRVGNPNGSFCGRCIKVCPWNKPKGWTHDLVRWMVSHTPFMNRFIIKMDDVWGYPKQDFDDKWWFDPVDRDREFMVTLD